MINAIEIYGMQKDIKDLKESGTGATPEQIAQIETNKNNITDLDNRINSIQPFEKDWGNVIMGLTSVPNFISKKLSSQINHYTISNNEYKGLMYINHDNDSFTLNLKTGSTASINKAGLTGDSQVCPIGDDKLLAVGWTKSSNNIYRGRLIDMNDGTFEEVGTGGLNGAAWNQCSGLMWDGDSKVYAINWDTNDKTVRMFDRLTKEWTNIGSLTYSRYGTSVGYYEGKIYVYGSHDRYGNYPLEVFDVTTKTTTVCENVPDIEDRTRSSLTIMNNQIYISNTVGLHVANLSDLTTWTTLDSNIKTLVLFNDKSNLYGWSKFSNQDGGDNLTKYVLNELPINVSQAKSTTENLAEYTGINGQLVVNTETNSLHVMDGETAGGHSLFPMKKVTQAEYDAITTKHPSTLYIITD